jgi:hypothetical protein
MDLIFSTPLGVYSFHCESSTLRLLPIEGPEFYGISANPYGLVVSHSCIDNARLTTHSDYVSSALGNVRIHGARHILQSTRDLLAPHQIECHGDSILVANSGRNCITVFNDRLEAVNYFPTKARWDVETSERKANHFNSVHLRNGLVYVVAHNHARLSAIWIFSWPLFDLVDVIGTKCGWAHNMLLMEHDMLVCNSIAGSLYSVSDKSDIWRGDNDGFVSRGLAASTDYLFVGLTQVADRTDRKTCDSAICVIDRKSMRLIERYSFPLLGCIHEIRLLNVPDECHGGEVIRLPERLLKEP